MTHPDVADARTAVGEGPDTQASPWDDIPPEVLYGISSYDTDSAGGCG